MDNITDLLFFSRGRGCGHAIPDLAIVHELRTLHPGAGITFASYGTGARVLAAAGERVIDLAIPDSAAFLDVAVSAGQALQYHRPSLVVAHEEPAALCVAKMMFLPTLYLSHWLPPNNDPFVQALAFADEILVMEHQRLRPEPPQAKGKTRYVGPVLRRFTCKPSDRECVRASLGLDRRQALILVIPGTRWEWSEKPAPWLDIVLEAYARVRLPDKQMLCVAGGDYEFVSARTVGREDITVIGEVTDLDRLMVAADVAVTKGTYCISRELAALGVPSISLSPGRNWIDDAFLRSIPTNTCLWAADVDATCLAGCIHSALDRGLGKPDAEILEGHGAKRVASLILGRLGKPAPSAVPIPTETLAG